MELNAVPLTFRYLLHAKLDFEPTDATVSFGGE